MQVNGRISVSTFTNINNIKITERKVHASLESTTSNPISSFPFEETQKTTTVSDNKQIDNFLLEMEVLLFCNKPWYT